MNFKPCPECGETLTYEKGYAGSHVQPPEPELLYCEYCDWLCEDDIENYMTHPRYMEYVSQGNR